MITVGWGFSIRVEDWQEPDLTSRAEFIEQDIELPSALSKDVVDLRKNVVFLKCPAHTDFMKNTFVFKSPIDINIDIDVNEQYANIQCDNIEQRLFDKIIDLRFLSLKEAGSSPYPILGIDFLSTFKCDQSLMLSIVPAHLHYNDFTAKTSVIPGTFDIGRWTRPVELVFEVKNSREKIQIKKGDALFYIKFTSDTQVKLEKIPTPWTDVDVCNELRIAAPFKSLDYRYSSLEDYKKSITNNNNT
jgi:hypothetical protein